ncbi:glycosyltransferase [Comamonas aquatica]|uniref:glycosyltransferase n=1 Tax=Comamonas aquatica TaxID=225991 RepID=UPI00244ABFC9|nr:glycosyltransferase [Comamonas aquatica]MDH1765981.1 glycosyltransferase [Comamonas aquatica]
MTPLQQANRALQGQDYARAIVLYVQALQQCAPLAPVLVGNLQRAQKAHRAQRAVQGAQQRPHVLVSSWDLSLNATGRAATLAQIWAGIGQAEIIGCLYPPKKSLLWQPLQGFPLPIHPLHIVPGQSFVQQALDFVLAHPCDLLHLSKPRWPNILLGLLYKLVWACPVWMDVDDEELAFAKADSPITVEEYLETAGTLPCTADSMASAASTCLGVGLAKAFDGVTVVNPALQQRYGGSIVRHARDAAHFAPSAQRRTQARAKLGIAEGDTVILFAGTPRAHKGLLETAQAIAQQRRSDLVFFIVGDFPANLRSLQQQIARMPGLKTIMLPNQNFQNLPDTLAAGDICVLLQDKDSLAAQYQTPAKLTDALAMGMRVLATPTPALADLAAHGAFIPVASGRLSQELGAVLDKQQSQAVIQPEPHPLFKQLLSTSANEIMLSQLWKKSVRFYIPQRLSSRLLELVDCFPGLLLLTGLTGERCINE